MSEEEKNEFLYLLEKYTPKYRKKLLSKMKTSFKNQVRSKTRKFIKENKINITKCCQCGNDFYIEFHHKNYDYPYIVAPLCKKCHGLQHTKKPPKIKFVDLEKLVE